MDDFCIWLFNLPSCCTPPQCVAAIQRVALADELSR